LHVTLGNREYRTSVVAFNHVTICIVIKNNYIRDGGEKASTLQGKIATVVDRKWYCAALRGDNIITVGHIYAR
jgi:hypothetical protein